MEEKGSGAGHLFRLLRRGANKMVGGSNRTLSSQSKRTNRHGSPDTSTWRPFVCPFVEASSDRATINVTPRFVSYYEVSILDKPTEDDEDAIGNGDDAMEHRRLPDDAPPTRHLSDCVAVGLATDSFHVHSRMPGWDRRSYGYHGDDSGLFHASGTMIRHFGQRFGAGDTVGCGKFFSNSGRR